jgi:release factor glutamine methyltransferase
MAATLGTLLRRGADILIEAGPGMTDTPGLDAETLLRHATGLSRERFLHDVNTPADKETAERFDALVARRAAGEPVAYLTGTKEFYGLAFAVDRRVLIPRPETESIVEEAARSVPQGATIVDAGTGSGAIAVALAVVRPDLRIVATDCSYEALAVALANIRKHAVSGRVGVVATDLAQGLGRSIGAVIANLPYIPTAVLPSLPASVRAFEPQTALDGGEDGFASYRALMDQIDTDHGETTFLLCEIGHDQTSLASSEVRKRWPEAEIRVLADLAGLPRLLSVRRAPRRLLS